MMNAVAVVVTMSLPILLVVGLLGLAEWRDRVRSASVARQIRLTDAIGAELGAIVAPVVKRRLGGRWQVEMAMPLGHPPTVGRVLAIADRVLPGRYELVLTPQEPVASRRGKIVSAAKRLQAA